MAGKVAIVTGAAHGIGSAIARRLGRDGYDVCLNYRSEPGKAEELAAQIRAMGRDAIAMYADMADLASVRKMYDDCLSHFGRIDLCVNNAGISSEVCFLDATEEDFDRMTAILTSCTWGRMERDTEPSLAPVRTRGLSQTGRVTFSQTSMSVSGRVLAAICCCPATPRSRCWPRLWPTIFSSPIPSVPVQRGSCSIFLTILA